MRHVEVVPEPVGPVARPLLAPPVLREPVQGIGQILNRSVRHVRQDPRVLDLVERRSDDLPVAHVVPVHAPRLPLVHVLVVPEILEDAPVDLRRDPPLHLVLQPVPQDVQNLRERRPQRRRPQVDGPPLVRGHHPRVIVAVSPEQVLQIIDVGLRVPQIEGQGRAMELPGTVGRPGLRQRPVPDAPVVAERGPLDHRDVPARVQMLAQIVPDAVGLRQPPGPAHGFRVGQVRGRGAVLMAREQIGQLRHRHVAQEHVHRESPFRKC